jgi:hypothetical protein
MRIVILCLAFLLIASSALYETSSRTALAADPSSTDDRTDQPHPHTRENLIVYNPAEKILFQGGFFYFDPGAPFPPKSRRAVMTFFASWLRNNRLAPERIYNVHGHGFATMEHVNKAMEIFTR